jgi:hypothetical protein
MKRRFVRELNTVFREPSGGQPGSGSDGSSGSEGPDRPVRRRGNRIPEAWTRVVKVIQSQRQQIRIYTIEVELQALEERLEARRRLTLPEHVLLFWPKEWARQQEITSLEQFRLSDEQLLKIGTQVSKIRAAIRARSLRLTPPAPVAQAGEEPPLTALQKRIQLGHFSSENLQALKRVNFTRKDPTPPGV